MQKKQACKIHIYECTLLKFCTPALHSTVAGSLRALEHSLLCETLTAEAAYQLGHHYIHQDMFKIIE